VAIGRGELDLPPDRHARDDHAVGLERRCALVRADALEQDVEQAFETVGGSEMQRHAPSTIIRMNAALGQRRFRIDILPAAVAQGMSHRPRACNPSGLTR
jgi:hypothetical protein